MLPESFKKQCWSNAGTKHGRDENQGRWKQWCHAYPYQCCKPLLQKDKTEEVNNFDITLQKDTGEDNWKLVVLTRKK